MDARTERRLQIASRFLQLQSGRNPVPVIKALSTEGQNYLKELVDFVYDYEQSFGEGTWFSVKNRLVIK